MVLVLSELVVALAECVLTQCAGALLAFAVRATLPREASPRRDDARPHGL
ncbi:hypothetical protein 01orf_00101 [Orf virus]|uniref:Uncharacterized protein n=1 Tax=Orf virus TaxID=10258 RepID=A0A6M6ABG6_ORFV|nr:hypothetical protein 01orf_00101 [Orf virus]